MLATFFHCRSCDQELPITMAQKRVLEGKRKYSRCMACEATAQAKQREERGEAINARRRDAWPRHQSKNRDSFLKAKYGISLDQWNEMFISQGRCCAICETKQPRGRGWQTDHNHETGMVRAILCHHCNSLLGHAKESPLVLMSAFRYLCKHGGGAEMFLSRIRQEVIDGEKRE